MKADTDSIQALYRANGFSEAKVTGNAKDMDKNSKGQALKVAEIKVTYTIEEGPQQKFGVVKLSGVDPSRQKTVQGMLQAEKGQPFSLLTLSGDRDSVLSYYVSHGFDQARVEIKQEVEAADKTATDVTLNVSEGQQVFIDQVLISGDRAHAAFADAEPDEGACGLSAGPVGAAGYAAEPVQPGAVQRSECGSAEPYGRRSAEECAGAVDRGQALGRDVRLRV